jgi:hypothetical protein
LPHLGMTQSLVVADWVIVVGTTCKVLQNLPFAGVVLSASELALFVDGLALLLNAGLS